MSRVALPRRQPDLFSSGNDLFDPPAVAEPTREEADAELARLFQTVQAADTLPFADAAAALAIELRVESLAKRLGPDGAARAAAFQAEMERLYAVSE